MLREPIDPGDTVELSQPANAKHSLQEQFQEQAKSNAQEDVQWRVKKTSRKSTTDLDESVVPMRIVQSEADQHRARVEKEKRDSVKKIKL